MTIHESHDMHTVSDVINLCTRCHACDCHDAEELTKECTKSYAARLTRDEESNESRS